MKTVEVHLGYFKQGDDLRSCIEDVGNNVQAIDKLAERLFSVVKHLDAISIFLGADAIVDILADTHCISIRCGNDVAQELVDEGLAYFPEYDEEDDL